MTDPLSHHAPPEAPSIDPAEIARFQALAEEWWDPNGQFRPLHKFNPVRLALIKDEICGHFSRDPRSLAPFEGLRLLDIGCGGGLLSEPMARLGASVTGVDAGARNIKTAIVHADAQGLVIDYRAGTAEGLLTEDERFDVVLNMEVVEHVVSVPDFISTCSALLKPGGLMICATLNRTAKAFALAVVGAEYILRWLPPGTHDWAKFVTPAELVQALENAGLTSTRTQGVTYDPLRDRFHLSADLGVNYLVVAVKRGAVVVPTGS